jgi:hypothetical protein
MSKFDRAIPPVETPGAHLVSKEDVGHGAASAARNDGYARRSKLRVAKSEYGSNMRKANNGEVSGEDDPDATEDDEDQTESDDDATQDDDPDVFAPFGTASFTRQDSNVFGLTNKSYDAATGQTGLQKVSNGLKRKRTASELSTTTILSTIERDDDEIEYPRKRISRRLSNEKGLLKYDARIIEIDEDIDVAAYSIAIEDSSEDEDAVYDGISQADDENDSDLEEMEEAMIIEEETARLTHSGATSIIDSPVNDGADSDFEVPSDIDLGFLNSEMDDIFEANESFFFQGLQSDPDTPRRKKSDASARRVRFQDEIDVAHTYRSSATASETDIDIFPDLLDNPFKSQDELPAAIRTHIDDDGDAEVTNGASSDGEGSCWDFGEEKASENFFSWHDEAESGSDGDNASNSDLSGYDCMLCLLCTFICIMLTQFAQRMVTQLTMTFLRQPQSEHPRLCSTAGPLQRSLLKSPHLSLSQGVGACVAVQSWARLLLMKKKLWPSSILTLSN